MRLLLLSSVFLAACASTSSSTKREAREREAREQQQREAPVAPTCSVRERVLAPVSRQPRGATMRALPAGLAITWVEHEGERDAVRVFVVDDKGAPRTPSAEVIDRQATLSLPDVAPSTPDGFIVSWTETNGRMQRAIDKRLRPHGDVESATGSVSQHEAPKCGREAEHLSCATPDGPMLIPHDEEPVASAPNGAVVSLGPSGLRLFVNDCKK